MPIDEILTIIRKQLDPRVAWDEVLRLCKRDQPSKLWDSLPKVNLSGDIAAARAWLNSNLTGVHAPTCVYLGLDTLNMNGGQGTNIEIGWKSLAIQQTSTDWAYDTLTRGTSHLMASLFVLQETYSRSQWEDEYSFADYLLFLAYSGLVIREALTDFIARQPMLFAWGFHDGDLFSLCRIKDNQVEMLCS